MSGQITYRTRHMLLQVHPLLAASFVLAARSFNSPARYVEVTEGLRTMDRQEALVAAGKSWTLQSKHLHGHAIDVAIFVDGKPNWELLQYSDFNEVMQWAADYIGIGIVWGGAWKQRDGVHFELNGVKGVVGR